MAAKRPPFFCLASTAKASELNHLQPAVASLGLKISPGFPHRVETPPCKEALDKTTVVADLRPARSGHERWGACRICHTPADI